MTFYSRIQSKHDQLMQRYGQGSIVLVKTTTTPGAEPYDPPVSTTDEYPLTGIVSGVGEEYANSETIVVSDKQVQVAVPDVMPEVGDIVKVDGEALSVLMVMPLPAAGDPTALRMICRG
jgi:hypothetical protein